MGERESIVSKIRGRNTFTDVRGKRKDKDMKESDKLIKKRTTHRLYGAVIIVAVIVFFVTLLSGGGKSATFTARLQGSQATQRPASGWPLGGSVTVVSNTQLQVAFTVMNTSTVAGTPTCQLTAGSPHDTYYGVDEITAPSTVAAHQAWRYADIITISGNGASHVTHVKISC